MRPALVFSAALLISSAAAALSRRYVPAQERRNVAPGLKAREIAQEASKGYLAARQSGLLWPYGGASQGQETVMGVVSVPAPLALGTL